MNVLVHQKNLHSFLVTVCVFGCTLRSYTLSTSIRHGKCNIYLPCNECVQEAEEAAKVQAAKKGGEGNGGKGGGRGSKAAGKKGKETPAVDADPAIPLPEKPPVSMKKRGEEDTDSKYIG